MQKKAFRDITNTFPPRTIQGLESKRKGPSSSSNHDVNGKNEGDQSVINAEESHAQTNKPTKKVSSSFRIVGTLVHCIFVSLMNSNSCQCLTSFDS